MPLSRMCWQRRWGSGLEHFGGMNDFIPIARVARIVAPISDGFHADPFENGQFHILNILAASDIAVSADIAPPQFPFPELLTGEVLSKNWFSSIHNRRHGGDYHQISDWNAEFIEWMRQSLCVCREGILDNLRPPSDYGHAPVEHVDTAGTHWNFPETLAWIATRNPLEVARMRYSRHWEAPIGDDDPYFQSRALSQNDSTRRRMIGWLVMATALNHCE
jgi:hypothetical protein